MLLGAACGGSAARTDLAAPRADAVRPNLPQPAPEAVGALALPALADLPAVPRSSSGLDADRFRYGEQFETVGMQNVTTWGTAAVLAADYAPGGPLSGLAYSIYGFPLGAFSGDTLVLNWMDSPPADSSYLILANYASGRWDWFPADLGQPFVLADLTPYLKPGDDTLYVAVFLAGDLTSQLNWLRWGGNIGPTAAISVDPTTGTAPITINFDASAAIDPDGSLVQYEWDWTGDGTYDSTTVEPSTAHLYSRGVNCTPRVRVTDNIGATATATLSPNLQLFGGGPIDPVAVLVADPLSGVIPLTVTLDASGSYDDSVLSIFQWDLDGDNVFNETDNTEQSFQNSPTAEVTFDEIGSYTVRVLVRDGAPDFNEATDSAVIAADIHGWYFVPVDRLGDSGNYLSLAIVDGNPAIAYRRFNHGLVYVRALDPDGAQWGAPLRIDEFPDCGKWATMAIIDGRPAISYYSDVYDGTFTTAVKYIRAADAQGSTWNEPQTLVDPLGNSAGFTSLAEVAGAPAISFYDGVSKHLKYIRASDPDGDSWGAPQTVDSGSNAGRYSNLLVVQGNPAISYHSGGGLKYVRATDATGSAWGTIHTVHSGMYYGEMNWLSIIDGNPALSYRYFNAQSDPNEHLHYCRANDVNGDSWGATQELESVGKIGRWSSLATIDGVAAITYIDAFNGTSGGALKLLRATDADGTAWNEPEIINGEVGSDGGPTSLQIINGRLTIAYRKGGAPGMDLMFAIYFP